MQLLTQSIPANSLPRSAHDFLIEVTAERTVTGSSQICIDRYCQKVIYGLSIGATFSTYAKAHSVSRIGPKILGSDRISRPQISSVYVLTRLVPEFVSVLIMISVQCIYLVGFFAARGGNNF